MKYPLTIFFVLPGLHGLTRALIGIIQPPPPRLVGIAITSRARRIAYCTALTMQACLCAYITAFGCYMMFD